MAARIVRAQFEQFTQARLAFVRSIADLSERRDYLEALLAEDAFEALKPMLHDKVATVQQTAALALGRMAGCSVEVAIELVKAGGLIYPGRARTPPQAGTARSWATRRNPRRAELEHGRGEPRPHEGGRVRYQAGRETL